MADRKHVQCCIVGGGPAGVVAGALLARAGIRVLVLEKHGDFLRDFRGDTVHPSTMEVLDELGWLDAFLQRPHRELQRIRVHLEDDELAIGDFTHSPTRAKFIALMPQWDFLTFLVEQARVFPGFELWMNANATELSQGTSGYHGVRGVRADEPFEVEADLVLAADGRHSLMRNVARLRVQDVGSPIDNPRKASEPSSTMAMATPMRAKDTAAGNTLGRSSRSKMRVVLAPVARAATTNSRLAKDRVVARMTRKSRGADTKANITVSLNSVTSNG